MPRARKSNVERAVNSMRVYLGSVDKTSLRDQQRLYARTMHEVDRLVDQTKLTRADVWDQVATEARARGLVLAIPGRDI